MLLLGQPAKVSWVEGMLKQLSGKLLPNSKTKEFGSVRSALRFIMETMNESARPSAIIDTDGALLHRAEIENMYAQIK